MMTGRSPVGSAVATAIGGCGIALWATETSLAAVTTGLPTFEVVALAFTAATLLSPLLWCITGESPFKAFRLPWTVWLLTVPSLVLYHACIYFCVHRVPAAPAALLQGCTPVFIVLGTAFMPGRRLRWWHVVGVIAGLEGLVSLAAGGHGLAAFTGTGSGSYLLLIGLAAGLWGLYSLATSTLGSVPTSALGLFYMASALEAWGLHLGFETWTTPTASQGLAVLALGVLPMGLALYCWDFGLKKGDVQALGVASYVEPLIGAALVVLLGQGHLDGSMLISGFVIIGGAVVGSANLFDGETKSLGDVPATSVG